MIGIQEKDKGIARRSHIYKEHVHSVGDERTPQLIVTLSPQKVVAICLVIVVVLLFMHAITQGIQYFTGDAIQHGFQHKFNLDRENNVPTWYASSALLLCSALLALIWRASRQNGERYAAHWLVLAILFFGLSLDEAASFHEMAVEPLRKTFHFSSYLYYAWVIPGMVFVLVTGLFFVRFLMHLPKPTRRLFLFAGFLYVGGAVGAEMLEAKSFSTSGGVTLFQSFILAPVEEGSEMLGVLVFLYALCTYMANYTGSVTILFEPSLKDSPCRSKVNRA